VLEEHVDQLPEQVVVGLGQLLAHERVVARGRRDAHLEAARRRGAVEREHHVVGPGQQRPLLGALERDRGQRALADDHGMDELDGDVAGVGPRRRRGADGDQAAAAREALGHPPAEARDPVRLGREEAVVRLGPLGEQRLDQPRRRARPHAGAPALLASRTR
jgi:hypothetical protein